jgi:hypothetical protein
MKAFLFIISILLLASTTATSQQDDRFYVTAYNSKIVNKRTGRVLTYGDIVYSRDTLLPADKDYYIGLANKYGMYELTPSTPAQQTTAKWGEFTLAVYNSFFNKIEIKHMDVRGIDTHVMDIARFFHPGDTLSENRILLLTSEKVVAKEHSLDNGNSYYISDLDTQENTIPIKNIKDTLLFSSADFPHGNSSRQYGPYDLYYQYYVNGLAHRKKITDFGIVFISADEASLAADAFLKYYKEGDATNEKELMTGLEFLFMHLYKAAPRGLLLKDLLDKKVKQYLENNLNLHN